MLKAMHGVDAFVAPIEPLAKDRAQAPLGEIVDEPVLLGERNETRRLDRPELRIVPAHQRLDAGSGPRRASDTLG